jgi:hypothetical protein
MWRFALSLGSLLVGGGLLLVAIAIPTSGCDPELNVIKTPGSEGGVGEGGSSSSSSSSSSSGGDGGESEGGNTDNDSGPIDDDSGTGPSGHKVDGVNDFATNEKLATTSSASGYDAYVSWDATRIYIGMAGSDVGSKATNKWVLVYIGVPGATGTTTGINYGGQQQPTLPFNASHHLRWKASGELTTVEVFSGGMWKVSDPFIPVVAGQQGNFMEMSVTRAALGATGKISVHINMLIEGGGADWTYAGVPSVSFTDGKNPNPFSKYFEFDLANTTMASSAYTPK